MAVQPTELYSFTYRILACVCGIAIAIGIELKSKIVVSDSDADCDLDTELRCFTHENQEEAFIFSCFS